MRILKVLVYLSVIFIYGSCSEEEPALELVYNDYVVPVKVIDEKFRLGARSTAIISNKSKVLRTINLPDRTVYWAYWLGAGPEPIEELGKIVLGTGVSKLTKDPFVAHAWGLLSTLNLITQGTKNCDFFLLTSSEGENFGFDDSSFKSFDKRPQSKNIMNNYIDIFDTPLDKNRSFSVGLRNQSYTSGVDVDLKIWAFVVKPL